MFDMMKKNMLPESSVIKHHTDAIRSAYSISNINFSLQGYSM